MPKLQGIRSNTQHTIRVQTPWTYTTKSNERLIITDIYCIPPNGVYTPPIPASSETAGDIVVTCRLGKEEFRAAVAALMDQYWKFTNETLLDPLGQAIELRNVLAEIAAMPLNGLGEDSSLRDLLTQAFHHQHPGRSTNILIPEQRTAQISRVDTEGRDLPPTTLQVQCIRSWELE